MIKILLAVTSVLAIFLLGAVNVFAATPFNDSSSVVLGKDEVVNQDYFAKGNSVTLSGTVNGDAYLVGGNINVEGTINGDLLAAGGVVNVRGRVTGNMRLVGGQIIISGQSGRNISAAGGSVTLTDSALVGGNLVTGAGSTMVFAPVTRDLTSGTGQLTLGNRIGGNVNSGVGQLVLTPNANIAGSLTYWSNTPAQVESGAVVTGSTTQYQLPVRSQPNQISPTLAKISVTLKVISFISALIIGFLLLIFLPVFTFKTTEIIAQKPWLSLLVGFLAVILTPIIIILFLVSVVGIPLGLILLTSFLIMIYFAKIFVSLVIGRKLVDMFGWRLQSGWTLVIGLVIYYLLTIIPIFGGLVALIVCLLGLGALVISQRDYLQEFRAKKIL